MKFSPPRLTSAALFFIPETFARLNIRTKKGEPGLKTYLAAVSKHLATTPLATVRDDYPQLVLRDAEWHQILQLRIEEMERRASDVLMAHQLGTVPLNEQYQWEPFWQSEYSLDPKRYFDICTFASTLDEPRGEQGWNPFWRRITCLILKNIVIGMEEEFIIQIGLDKQRCIANLVIEFRNGVFEDRHHAELYACLMLKILTQSYGYKGVLNLHILAASVGWKPPLFTKLHQTLLRA